MQTKTQHLAENGAHPTDVFAGQRRSTATDQVAKV